MNRNQKIVPAIGVLILVAPFDVVRLVENLAILGAAVAWGMVLSRKLTKVI